MATERIADQLVQVLLEAGAERIYGVVGDSLNPVVDAVRRSGRLEWVYVRNEEAGAFAAAAEAQTTGRLAVCAGSCGPGNTHLVQGLYDARRSGAPVLALASQIPSRQIGTDYFQETRPDRLLGEAADYTVQVAHSGQMPRLARIAVQEAMGAPGTAVLVLPGDVADEEASAPAGTAAPCLAPATVHPDPGAVRELARRLDAAESVALFCGAGVRGARDAVLSLADRLNAPVGHTLRGKEWIQYGNPFDVGMIGLLGYGACHEALHEADLVLMLGCDFPYDEFLPGRDTVQVDRDARRLGRRTPLVQAVHGDVGATLEEVLPLLTRDHPERFLVSMLKRHERALSKVVEAYTHDIERMRPIHPEYAARLLDEAADDDAVFTVDTGMNNVWAARYLSPNGRRRIIGSFTHGSMANALPHAIGAAFAGGGRQVVAMAGDGGLSMLMGELLTVVQYRLPVKTVVFNNASLGMVKLEMMVDGLPSFGTDHPQADFSAIARACGMPAWRVEDPAGVDGALREAFAADGPALVELVTDSNALSIPAHIKAGQVKGFALSAGRTVLEGGVGKMLDLARSNLRNVPRP
ncbi:pyruvate dehydrogenase [Nocardiopsis sp. RSe5-2]|uniref:Pyruvate dehydrogenase n=1 Tax=Nocardiopsis endophytica TaxID=3018445 RepID=A0ABT4U0J8_9ACTN|nr:pyruvate dehydrogenase [Nocardiopsis endophytica]MDA2810473.1 pyruvate dehydrogenase [Nocardiopsis endophytica]